MVVIEALAGLAALGLSYVAALCVVLLGESLALKRSRARRARQALRARSCWRPDPDRVRAIQLRLQGEADAGR